MAASLILYFKLKPLFKSSKRSNFQFRLKSGLLRPLVQLLYKTIESDPETQMVFKSNIPRPNPVLHTPCSLGRVMYLISHHGALFTS